MPRGMQAGTWQGQEKFPLEESFCFSLIQGLPEPVTLFILFNELWVGLFIVNSALAAQSNSLGDYLAQKSGGRFSEKSYPGLPKHPAVETTTSCTGSSS